MKPETKKNSPSPVAYSAEALIKSAAYDIGFSEVGIAGVEPSQESNRTFDRWIDRGLHGDMRYLSGGRDKRHDPGLLLPGARSVICVAVNYYSQVADRRNQQRRDAGEGVFSLYAQERDYHLVLGEMLAELERRLKDFFTGMESAASVDTQPISERDLAVTAGIAWLGKNTMAISPEFGSWIFLGELITNLELAAGVPLRTLCGSCTRCMDACPTGALDEAYVLDATKCISYLTIEKRGEIPAEFHGSIADNLFGCDDCQSVCPFNNYARDSRVFTGRDTNPLLAMTLGTLADLPDEKFRELSHDSAIDRCKPQGMRRNARIVGRNMAEKS